MYDITESASTSQHTAIRDSKEAPSTLICPECRLRCSHATDQGAYASLVDDDLQLLSPDYDPPHYHPPRRSATRGHLSGSTSWPDACNNFFKMACSLLRKAAWRAYVWEPSFQHYLHFPQCWLMKTTEAAVVLIRANARQSTSYEILHLKQIWHSYRRLNDMCSEL